MTKDNSCYLINVFYFLTVRLLEHVMDGKESQPVNDGMEEMNPYAQEKYAKVKDL